MVDERELLAAIAECESAPATVQSMSKLAVFNAVYDRYFAQPEAQQDQPCDIKKAEQRRVQPVPDDSSEFVRLVGRMDWAALLDILDELMETIKILQPRLYEAVMRKLRG